MQQATTSRPHRRAPGCAAGPALPTLEAVRPVRLLVTLLIFTGCDGACSRTHEATERVATRVISVEAEQQLGEQMVTQLEQQVRLHPDPAVQEYVSTLGQKLADHATKVPAGTQLRFQVIDDPDTLNAMALPGGHIYVYSGLLGAADDESELVGVLAHEIAHVMERHVVANLVMTMGAQVVMGLALSGDSGELERLVASLAGRGAISAFGRTAEREADTLAVRMIHRAGWDPAGYVRFFEKLATARTQGAMVDRFLATHPHPEERAQRAQTLIEKLPPAPSHPPATRFADIQSRLQAPQQ